MASTPCFTKSSAVPLLPANDSGVSAAGIFSQSPPSVNAFNSAFPSSVLHFSSSTLPIFSFRHFPVSLMTPNPSVAFPLHPAAASTVSNANPIFLIVEERVDGV